MGQFIRESGFWTSLGNEGFAIKAPIFPVVMSFIYGDFFRFFFTTILSFTLILGSLFITSQIKSEKLRFIGIAALVFSTPVLMVNSFLWPDALMVFVLVLCLLMMVRYLETHQFRTLVFLSVLIGVLTMIRFAALFVGLGTLIFLLLRFRTIPFKHLIVFALISFTPFLVWLLVVPDIFIFRIDEFQETHFGDFLHNSYVLLHALSLWILPNIIPIYIRIVAIILLFGLIIFKSFQKKQTLLSQYCIVLFFTYFLGLHFFFRIPIDTAEKYLTPMVPVLIPAILISINSWYQTSTFRKFVIPIFIIWLIYPVARTTKNAFFWKEKICIENTSKRGLQDSQSDSQD